MANMDFAAAMECRQPPRAVPVWEIEFQAWDAASGKHMMLGKELESLSPAGQESALHSNAEIMLWVAREMHFAALTVPGGYWEHAPGVLAYYCLPPEARVRQIQILRKLAPADLTLVAVAYAVIAMPGATDYEAFAYRLFDAPDEVEQSARDVLKGGLRAARELRDLGIEAVVTSSDIADNKGVYYSPSQMQRFVLPYLHQWATAIREMGMYAIMHTDGNINACLDDLADSGLNAVQAVDPTAGMDIVAAKRQVAGRLCLCGNVDCGLLLTGRPEQVYQATRQLLLDCKTGGGFVLGVSNAVQPDVPIENYRAIIQAWRDQGRY
jgi:uroporphyrinogen decarboxylase